MSFYKSVSWLVGVIIICASLYSCVPRSKIVYFNQMENTNYEFARNRDNDLRIKPNDLLTIIVSAPEQDAAVPFNLPVMSFNNNDAFTQNLNQAPQLQSYLVNPEGLIDFPVLGKINVEGLYMDEVKMQLTAAISKYVKDPIVNVQLINFEISVLGEVSRPGTYKVKDNYISLTNALGLAGDLTIYGRRDKVLIIREEKDQVTHKYLDLTNPNTINSPYYYLKQNDVVYVEPNGAQRQSAAVSRNAGIYVSVVSVLVSLIVLFTR